MGFRFVFTGTLILQKIYEGNSTAIMWVDRAEKQFWGEKEMIQRSASKYKGKNFIRVLLSSGTRFNPMGDEELAIFCECEAEEPSVLCVNKEGLVCWVNNNPGCKRNQSNERYEISKQADAMSIVFLTDREIQACQNANRIYPCRTI